MQTFVKTLCVILLVTFLVPTLFGAPNVRFKDKVTAMATLADDFEPLPSFPSFPTVTDESAGFFDAFANFFRYIGSIGRWVVDFLVWTYESVIIVIRLLNVLLLNHLPEVA